MRESIWAVYDENREYKWEWLALCATEREARDISHRMWKEACELRGILPSESPGNEHRVVEYLLDTYESFKFLSDKIKEADDKRKHNVNR